MKFEKGQKVVSKTNHQQLMVVLEVNENDYTCAWTAESGQQSTGQFVEDLLESADAYEGRTQKGAFSKDDLLLS